MLERRHSIVSQGNICVYNRVTVSLNIETTHVFNPNRRPRHGASARARTVVRALFVFFTQISPESRHPIAFSFSARSRTSMRAPRGRVGVPPPPVMPPEGVHCVLYSMSKDRSEARALERRENQVHYRVTRPQDTPSRRFLSKRISPVVRVQLHEGDLDTGGRDKVVAHLLRVLVAA